MNTARYLIAHDGGYGDRNVLFFCDEPTAEDLSLSAAGLRTIVRLSDLHLYGESQRWIPIQAAQLGIPPDIDSIGPYHDHPLSFLPPARGRNPKEASD